DKAAQVGDPLLEDLARVERPALEPQPAFQLVPDPVVGPPRKVLVRPDLEVEPRERRRAHAVQRETAFAVGVDQLVVGRRRRGQNAEPSEGIHALEGRQDAGRNAVARNAVEAVAAGEKVAADLDVLALSTKANCRSLRLQVMDAHALDLEMERPAGVEPGSNEVLHNLLLTIDGDPSAAGEPREVDPVPLPL